MGLQRLPHEKARGLGRYKVEVRECPITRPEPQAGSYRVIAAARGSRIDWRGVAPLPPDTSGMLVRCARQNSDGLMPEGPQEAEPDTDTLWPTVGVTGVGGRVELASLARAILVSIVGDDIGGGPNADCFDMLVCKTCPVIPKEPLAGNSAHDFVKRDGESGMLDTESGRESK